LTPEEENRIMWVVGAIYAGADNAVSALTTFVLAMVMFPEAQRKAQDEIDRVLGTGRFPLMTDRQRLPYVEALFKEVLRWHPVVPLGVPHRLTQDDQWQEYTLPKGSTIIPNIFAMGHTEDDSNDFKPERHLDRKAKIDANEEYNDPTEYVFGFGRRVCPGKDLADASVWLGIANLLAAFNFSKKSDGKGGFVDVKDEYTPGIISHPKPFECSIVPRLSSTPALVHSTCADDH
jgi:cytochrome P450